MKDLNPKLSYIDKLMVKSNRKRIPYLRRLLPHTSEALWGVSDKKMPHAKTSWRPPEEQL
jgi:hypothetical protein